MLTVGHYLGIYRFRKSMRETGTTSYPEDLYQAVCALVANLQLEDPSAPCELTLETVNGHEYAVFTSGGKVLGRLP